MLRAIDEIMNIVSSFSDSSLEMPSIWKRMDGNASRQLSMLQRERTVWPMMILEKN